jgi:sulfite reductase alpha subunit-like flavoprotein
MTFRGSQRFFEVSIFHTRRSRRWKDLTMTQAEYEEEVLVLFGSQKGHSEIAADEFITKMSKHLSTDAIEELTKRAGVTVTPKLMKLDDFLKADNCPWTRLVVIIVSSFGTGHAPEGGKEFRILADTWIADYKKNPDKPKILGGVQFALLGANLVGDRGVADAFDGAMAQQKMIDEYVDGIWPYLANVVVQEPVPEETLAEMKSLTSLPETN